MFMLFEGHIARPFTISRVGAIGTGALPARKSASWALCLLTLLAFAPMGCGLLPDAVGVSNTRIDFGLNETPFPLYVWNARERTASLRIQAEADVSWIQITPRELVSARPEGGEYDKRSMIIRVDRTQLDKGEHEGVITLRAALGKPVTVQVSVLMDRDGRLAKLNIQHPVALYSKPYLLDFVFALQDEEKKAIVAEPAQFTTTAFEDDIPVRVLDTGLALRRAPNRQLLADFVLDYSLSMRESIDAVAIMEDIARNDVLHQCNAEARVGITAFSREDKPPVEVAALTNDHAHIRQRLAAIQSDLGPYASGSTMFDALMLSLDKFEPGNPLLETRHIFLITDGYDVSSQATLDDVVNRARSLFVKINVVGVGLEPHLLNLLELSGRSQGAYFAEQQERANIIPHVRSIMRNLDGQYRLRWATMVRRDVAFRPSFHIEFGNQRAVYAASQRYQPSRYAGNPLRGVIRVSPLAKGPSKGLLFGLDYAPRLVKDFRIYLEASRPFAVHVIEAAEGGLISDWHFEQSVEDNGGIWLDFYSASAALPFAAYGPMFHLDFGEIYSETDELEIQALEIDNTLYEDDIFFVFRE